MIEGLAGAGYLTLESCPIQACILQRLGNFSTMMGSKFMVQRWMDRVVETGSLALDRVLAALDERVARFSRRGFKDGPLAVVLVGPALVLVGVFGIAPMAYALYLSLFRLRGQEEAFVGLANYAEAMGSAPFWDSVLVTVYYVLGTVPAGLVLSFLAATVLFRLTRLRNVFRTVYFLPFVTSVVAAATVWRVLLEPTSGVASQWMELAGLPAQTWLLEPRGILHLLSDGRIPPKIGPSLALCCVMLFEVWRSSGFMIVVFLAGLSAMPRELEEAARLDGAGWYRTVRHVTLPMLSPTLFFLTTISVIGAFQAFSGIYALTGNGRGPLDTTQNLTVYLYTNFYEFGRLGYGSAIAVILCLALVVLTLVQWRVVRNRVHYS